MFLFINIKALEITNEHESQSNQSHNHREFYLKTVNYPRIFFSTFPFCGNSLSSDQLSKISL